MKRIIFTLCMSIFSLSYVLAQQDILLADFENNTVGFTTMVNINPAGSMEATIVDNPVKAGLNTSNKVWEWKRLPGAAESPNWAGFWATLTNEIPAGYNRIEFKYLRTNANSQPRIKVEGAVNKEINPTTPAKKVNEWETMVFDLAGNGIQNIKVLSIFPDYYEPVNVNAISYVDDIKVIFGPGGTTTPGDSLVLFHDSGDPRFYDPSWVNTTAPSTVVAESFDPTGTTKDKLPVVTTPVKGGTNALKLQWNSATGGNWMALVASIGWKAFNLKNMTYLKFWVNSPAAMDTASMPLLHFEAIAGTPSVTGKVRLANYLKTGLTANKWTQVTIPLADIWAKDLLFQAKDTIKGVFFSQNAMDAKEHTLYLDEFVFYKLATGIDNLSETTPMKAFYSNGEIRFNNYTGHVRIFDMIGRLIKEGDAVNGTFSVNLYKGIYIISTTAGNTKIALP
ncbi:MAG: hypothetical protein ACM3P1_10880 [Candidatus Saccharibacteria bacterium]